MKKNSLFYKIKVSWWFFFFFSFVKKIEFIDAEAIADNDQQLLCDSEDEERERKLQRNLMTSLITILSLAKVWIFIEMWIITLLNFIAKLKIHTVLFVNVIILSKKQKTHNQSCTIVSVEIWLHLINLLALKNLSKNLKRP